MNARILLHIGASLTIFGLVGSAWAHHPDDSCPDTHVDGPNTIDGMVVHQDTWEIYPNGVHLPVGTPLRATARGTAIGYCDKFVPSGGQCAASTREYKDFVAFNTWQFTQNAVTNSESSLASEFIPGSSRQQFDGPVEHLAVYVANENLPGILTFRQRGGINDTTCKVSTTETPFQIWTPKFVVYLLPENRCPGGDALSRAGNPCNAATGNKQQVERDYVSPASGLSFIRTYNSQIPIDFGLGHGWMSNWHKRLEKFGNSMRIRRGDAAGEVFTASAGIWSGPADSPYKLTQDGTGYTVTLRGGASERYGLDYRIVSETDVVGKTTEYTYDVAGRLLTVAGPFGHVLSFSYDSTGHLESVIDPALQEIEFAYDADSNLTSVTYQDGTVRTYHYELTGYPFHALTGITDENGDRYATFGYHSSNGKASFTQHATTTNGLPQEKYSLTYTSATQTTVTDAAGVSEVLTFINQHQMPKLLSRINQVDGKGITQTFDANNNLDVSTDAEGHKTKYTYNATNQRISMIEGYQSAQARTTTYQYLSPSVDLITRVIMPSTVSGQQREVITNYNPDLTIASITAQGYRPGGASVSRTTSMVYNSQGQVTQIDGSRTDVSDLTLFEYYECTTGEHCGQLSRSTNALGHATTFDSYDAHARLTQSTDPNGLITTYTYDQRGRTASITTGSRVTAFTYDDAGQLQTITDPNGRMLTHSYDAGHYLRSITDNVGNKISYTYDVKGNRTTDEIRDSSNTLVKTVTRVYDLRNRIDTINAAGSITDLLFDAVGNLKQETNPNSNSASHSYDPLNRLTQTIDALTGVTVYSYDNQDQLAQLQAPNGASTTYVYDDLGNLMEQSSPDTGLTTYTYDAAGNRLSMVDARGIATASAYDALNRLTGITYPTSALNRTFAYDAGSNQKGRLTSIADASGTAAYSYNVHGELTTQTRSIAGTSFTTEYGYDSAGQLVTISYPSSGRVVTYSRNAMGQITGVSTTIGGVTTSLATNIGYLPFGPVNGLTLGNGIVETRGYDQQYRVQSISDTGSTSIRSSSYTYDPGGNIDRIQDNLNSANSQDFVQDPLDRITSDASSYGAVTYLYDAAGNRTERRRTGVLEQLIAYTANSNRLSAVNGVSFTYDAAGNTLSDGVGNRSFTYDDTSRLVQTRVGGSLKATSVYNAHGQRVKKIEATGAQRTVYFHYGLGGELLGETFHNSAAQKIIEREYIWLDESPLAFAERTFDVATGGLTASRIIYLHTDHLGTPRLATDALQRVVWRWKSDGFGSGAGETDPDGDTLHMVVSLRFPGQYFDDESELHYNYFRDYDPAVGRYVESDPIGLRGGMNTYAYVGGNPISRTDPTGLARECPLRLQIFLALLSLKVHNFGSLWLCTYDCNTSCPEDPSLIFTVIELRFHPDWGCRRTYLLY